MATEDFTTYTEVDPNNRIAVASGQIIGTSVTRNEDAYVYKDMGVDHFDGDFEHLVDVKMVKVDENALLGHWSVSNAVNDLGAASGLRLSMEEVGPAHYLRIYTSANAFDTYTSVASGTWYYLTIARSGTTITVKIYSDAARTNLLDTLTVVEDPVIKYRYVYGFSSWNTGHALAQTGYTANLDLQELVTAGGYAVIF